MVEGKSQWSDRFEGGPKESAMGYLNSQQTETHITDRCRQLKPTSHIRHRWWSIGFHEIKSEILMGECNV